METIKILCDMPVSYSGKLLLFDGMEGRSRIVNLRTRQPGAGDIERYIYRVFPKKYPTLGNTKS